MVDRFTLEILLVNVVIRRAIIRMSFIEAADSTMLNTQEWIVIGVIVATFGLVISNRLRVDVVALLVLLTLGLTQVLTPVEAISGFSSPVVVTIMSLFIVTRALEETGVAGWLADRLRALGGGSETRLILALMGTAALAVFVMNLIAAGALLLPLAIRIARDTHIKPSKLLIPVSFGTLIGGTASYFATANVILSTILQGQGLEGLSITDFLPTGSLIILAGLTYMALVGRRLLPDRESLGSGFSPGRRVNLYETYQLEDRLWEVRIPADSKLAHQTLSQSGIGSELGVTVLGIWRDHDAILAPSATEAIEPGDFLLVLGREERVAAMTDWGALLGRENGYRSEHDYSVELTEVVIPPRSTVIGKTLKDLNFRNKFGLTSVALWRGGRSYRTDVGLFPLQVGDALLMVGSTAKIKALSSERDFLVLQSDTDYAPSTPQKALPVILILLVALAAAFLELVPIPEAMLAAAVGMVLVGAVSMDEAYRAIEWRVIFLIAGMIPLSIAIINTGLAARVSDLFVAALNPYGDLALIAGLFALTVALVQVMGGQVTALVVGPVAVTAALQAGVNPQAVAVATATACSTAFLLPTAHPVNILMMAPGGYVPRDFTRVGVGMTLIVTATLLGGMLLFWGIR
jgi:di/tricarboxylate transporter